VWILRSEDLDSDEWEERVAGSPYAPSGAAAAAGGRRMMKQPLRQLTVALLRSSCSYYASLAERAEGKFNTWRNRYHSTNSSFEVNSLVCVVRCARYAFKSGVLRELEASVGENGDPGPAARHYEEAYRWILELHRRILRWRGGSFANIAPATPGAPDEPKFFESPGGGIGVELSRYTAAPWRVYGELAEVSLRVGKEIKAMLKGEAWKDPEDDGGGNRGRSFVGEVVTGGAVAFFIYSKISVA
jgi:hypothetical protein